MKSKKCGTRDAGPGPLPCITVHLIATEASSIARSFTARVERRKLLSWTDDTAQPLSIIAVDSQPTFSEVERVLRAINSADGSPPPVVVVTDTVSEELGLLGTLVADISAADATVYEHNEAVWTPVSRGPLGLRQYGLNLGAPMGDPGEASRAIALLDDARAIAELSHTEYLLNYVSPADVQLPKPERRASQNYWEQLDEFYRYDNERPVRQALMNLHELRDMGGPNFLSKYRPDAVKHNLELSALDRWIGPYSGSPKTDKQRAFQSVCDGFSQSSIGDAFGNQLSTADMRTIFLRFGYTEHLSWLKKRQEGGRPWTRPTLEERGFVVQKKCCRGTYLEHDPSSELSKLKMEQKRRSPEILSWDELISPQAQETLRRTEWIKATATDPEKSKAVRKAYASYCKVYGEKSPGKAFDQVIAVLYHLDALGYLSAVLGAGNRNAKQPHSSAISRRKRIWSRRPRLGGSGSRRLR